jgi:hypothetical protein
MAKRPREFGKVPEWSKTGPIDLRNYPFRVEMHCSSKTGDRAGNHPSLKLDSPDFLAWQEYFEQHLRGRPTAFSMLVDKAIEEMTVPEQVPQWFDPSFTPHPGWRSTWPEYTLRNLPPGRLYNVLVRTDAPQYAAMVAKGESYPQPSRWWRHDPNGRGVWIPHNWLWAS